MFGPSQNSGPWRSSGKKATSAGIRTGPCEGSVAAPHVLTSSPAFERSISLPSPTTSRSTICNWWGTMRCGSTGLTGTPPACIPGHCCEHCVRVRGARGEDRDLQAERPGTASRRTSRLRRRGPGLRRDPPYGDRVAQGHGPQAANRARKSLMPVSPSPSISPPGVPQAASRSRKSLMPTFPSSSRSPGQGQPTLTASKR